MSTKSRTRSKVRLSRALGVALTPKAARYLEKRPYGPGQHGRTKRKADSDYAVRLREKQRLRAQYGIREAQLRTTFNEARRQAGLTGENLVELLEMRLDALVLRSGFARTMSQARQMVVHRHIMVDGQRVDRPSFRVSEGQLIHVHQRSETMTPFQVAAAGAHRDVLPAVAREARRLRVRDAVGEAEVLAAVDRYTRWQAAGRKAANDRAAHGSQASTHLSDCPARNVASG